MCVGPWYKKADNSRLKRCYIKTRNEIWELHVELYDLLKFWM